MMEEDERGGRRGGMVLFIVENLGEITASGPSYPGCELDIMNHCVAGSGQISSM